MGACSREDVMGRISAAAVLLAMSAGAAGMARAEEPLPAGEYSCVGSGGEVLLGLGFRLMADGTYTDLDNTTSGTWTISGDEVTFTGGNLDGYSGRDIKENGFTIGRMASCQ